MADQKSPFSNYAHGILTANALRTPNKVALTYCGETSRTYDELDREVNRVANALLAAGVTAGQRVAALMNETINVATTYLAQFKIGSVVGALNPYWTEDVIADVVDFSECTAFVYDSSVDHVIERIRPKLPRVRTWIRVGGPGDDDVVDLDALAARAGDTAPELGGHGQDVLALFFTSGSTGLPKAVVYTHDSALATARLWLDFPHDEHSVFGTGSIIWGVGFPAIVGPALFGGMRLVLEQDWGPDNFLRVVPREGVTHVSQIPSFYSALLGGEEHKNADLSSLRAIILGGEPLAPALLERIKERLPDAGVYCYYGQTEAPYTCAGRLDDGSQDLRSSGRPRTGYAVKVTDPHGNALVGEVGELELTGPHVTKGYEKQPDKTAEVLRDGWFVGGDLGIIDEDGYVTVLGRRVDNILKHGQWSQPPRIEEEVVALDGVAEAGIVGVPEQAEEQEAIEQRILVAVVPRAGHDLTEDAVRAALTGRLPAHQHPDRVVIADELPHTQDASGGPGKLLRRDIRTKYAHMVEGA